MHHLKCLKYQRPNNGSIDMHTYPDRINIANKFLVLQGIHLQPGTKLASHYKVF